MCLPPKLAQQLGNMGQICIITRVTQTVHLIDPISAQSKIVDGVSAKNCTLLSVAEMSGATFWRYPFQSLCQSRQLTKFLVMEVDLVLEREKRHVSGAGQLSNKVTFICDQYTSYYVAACIG